MKRVLNHKDALCSGTSRLSLCGSALVVAVFASLFVAVLQLSTGPALGREMRCILVALAISCLLEVVRSYWTERHWPGSAVGTLRFFALWLGIGVVLYLGPWPLEWLLTTVGVASQPATPSLDPQQLPSLPILGLNGPPTPGGSDGFSLVTAVLGFVLAMTTLVATKVAADAKTEVQAVREELHAAKDTAFVAECAAFDLNVQRLLAWRFEIEAVLSQCSQAQAAELYALQKTINALKRMPLELARHWGSSALDNLKLTNHALQADTLFQATPDLSKSVALVLGHSGGENQLRELGKALGHFLDVLRSRHPHPSASEDASWEALAQLARRLERI